jgi:hypothetical protein
MRASLVLLLAAQVARADEMQELDRDATPLLDGALAVRLAGGTQLDSDAGAHLDWGDERLVIVARDLGATRAGTVRDRIALALRDDGEACAPLAPLELGKTAVAFAATPRAPRKLVYAAFAADRGGRLRELAFYGDAALAPLAARIAATLVVREPHAQPRPSGLVMAGCELVTGERNDPPAKWSVELWPADGWLSGGHVKWSRWRDNFGFHAEAVTPTQHVICNAADRAALDVALKTVP